MFKFIATLIALFTALNSYTAVPAKDAPSKEEQKRIYEEQHSQRKVLPTGVPGGGAEARRCGPDNQWPE